MHSPIYDFSEFGDDELKDIWNAYWVLQSYDLHENEDAMAELEAEMEKRGL